MSHLFQQWKKIIFCSFKTEKLRTLIQDLQNTAEIQAHIDTIRYSYSNHVISLTNTIMTG